MTDTSDNAGHNAVDASLRRALSQDVRRLITGRMTNDEFDDVYDESYESSSDRTVREIAGFCYSLYSSDLPLPYRLRGWHAVDKEARLAAARCVLFLRSGRRYEWPPTPDNPALRALAGLAMFLGVPLGVALAFFWLPIAIDGWDYVVGAFAVLGLLTLAASLAFCIRWPEFMADDWKAYYQSGDFGVWPFVSRDDFDDANRTRTLFARG